MFLERINHVTGKREWAVADEDYDMAQELARSRFADMILDYDRNDMFLAGLKTMIEEKKQKGERAHVLDIGTGTGLLSLMAAREGADRVTALEVFAPMAECATKITQNSEWKDRISVISTRSTDLSHLGEKPNIIVAEVFDTELNGEGALRTFKEALTNLVQPGCRVVPSLGRVWAVPVRSEYLRQFNRIPKLNVKDRGDCDNNPLGSCPGSSSVFDVQLSRVRPDQFIFLSDPVLAFSFDFESAESIIFDESFKREAVCKESGRVDAVMMWWDLDMDRTGKNWIDMAPSWVNEKFAWRDHWMQAVYYLPNDVELEKEQKFTLNCSHDEFSMWFSVGEESVPRPYCNCGLHTLLTRQSIYRLNSVFEDQRLSGEVQKLCGGKNVVVLGEGSLLGLMAAQHANEVIVVESNIHFLRILRKYAKFYELSNLRIVTCIEDVLEKPDAVIGEPFYLSAMNPWQNLRFWHEANDIRSRFGGDIAVHPKQGVLYGMCEQFTDLHKIASPVGTVNGFDLSLFDEISQKARECTDAIVDEQPLWEYGGLSKGDKFEVMTFDVSTAPTDQETMILIPLSSDMNGIPLWMEWRFGDLTISTGLEGKVSLDSEPSWTPSGKQGVFLLPPNLIGKTELSMKTSYSLEDGDLSFQFE